MKQFASFFEAIEQGKLVAELRDIYQKIKDQFNDLPVAPTKPAMTNALRQYEESHPELCSLIDDTDELYGWTRGQNRLAKYIQWVYVPAIKDPSVEQEESSKTALGRLLERTVRTRLDFSSEIENVKTDVAEKYRQIVDSHAFTGVALTISGFACPATSLLETALTPVFTDGELTLD